MRLQRKPKKSDPISTSKLVLEEIIGLTAKNSNGLASNVSTGDCVYLAGCVVVVYNVESGTQSHLMVLNRMPKPLSCVAVLSRDGGFIAAGESGHQPAVLVWDYSSRTLLCELKVHQFGVTCISFSPDGKHLVSVGYPHDGYICLWDWRSGSLFTKLKSSSFCSAISSVCFSSDANFFITAGKKHLKFWTVGLFRKALSTIVATGLPTMEGKSASLGCQKGSSLISVVSGSAASHVGSEGVGAFYPIYALTDTGRDFMPSILWVYSNKFCGFKGKSHVQRAFAMSVSNKLIACACNNGVVQFLTTDTLNYAGSLQYSEAKEHHKPTELFLDKGFESQSTHPDAIACQFSTTEKLVVLYGNHNLYVWDVCDVNKVSRCCVLVSHSGCIWDVKNLSCENMHDPALACVARGCCGGISFATCSTDGTIRLWDLALQSELRKNEKPDDMTKTHLGNISPDTDQVCTMHLGAITQGFRSMATSSDGKYLAAGDCQGSLHVYNLHTSEYTYIQDAHEAEILTLTFIINAGEKVPENYYLLASGGKDRMIHLYDVKRGFKLIGSLDDHSAAVTSVKLTSNSCKILSCSADRSLVFRDVAITNTGCKISRCHHQIASNGTVYDMAIDSEMEFAVTVGQDKKINTFNISSGKLVKTFKQDGDFGEPIKVSMDPSSSYLVCSYSNKSMCMYDFSNGELVAQATGHSEVITGVIFLPDCKHIISVGGDGCIFVWKVPSALSIRMLQRMKDRASHLSPASMAKPLLSSGCTLNDEVGLNCDFQSKDVGFLGNIDQDSERVLFQEASSFRFSISRLPNWAQAKVTSKETVSAIPESTLLQQPELELPSSSMISNGGNPVPICPTEVCTPCRRHSGGSELYRTKILSNSFDNSLSSVSPPSQGSPRSFAMDKRWLTIHTVYLDLMDSPENKGFKDKKTQVCAPNLLKTNQSLEGGYKAEDMKVTFETLVEENHVSTESFCETTNWIADNTQRGMLNEHGQHSIAGKLGDTLDQYEDHSTETSCKASAKQMNPHTCEKTKDDEDSDKSNQNDLFSQHFSSLSSALKLEGRRSSTMRRYSSHFVVRRDHLTSGKKLFGTPYRSSGDKAFNCSVEVAPQNLFGDLSQQVLKDEKKRDVCNQDQDGRKLRERSSSPTNTLHNSDPSCCFMINHPVNIEGIEDTKERFISGEPEITKITTECNQTLLSLDVAADNALISFSKFDTYVSRENTLHTPGIELYNRASELLPLIARKLNELGELVKSSKRGLSSSPRGEEDLAFEPLFRKICGESFTSGS
ncbi:hypothetical protein GIB67_027341 [Kingdonia uniflora]|uniref:MABP1/WDR62 second WD40 domain-containing protein n=1 Tax=Kingdonia uniflora TaxID=39325 RepID=A0A7J7MFD5_9MAGN|nr:hypothetical protein GIB67_027341 [Kingdonia uniflora]